MVNGYWLMVIGEWRDLSDWTMSRITLPRNEQKDFVLFFSNACDSYRNRSLTATQRGWRKCGL